VVEEVVEKRNSPEEREIRKTGRSSEKGKKFGRGKEQKTTRCRSTGLSDLINNIFAKILNSLWGMKYAVNTKSKSGR
jgi:hypothetical protein